MDAATAHVQGGERIKEMGRGGEQDAEKQKKKAFPEVKDPNKSEYRKQKRENKNKQTKRQTGKEQETH